MTVTALQIVADKIAKIAAHADSAMKAGNLAESDAFMTKAQQLLEEYGLSMQDVVTLEADDPVGVDMEAFTYFAAEGYLKSMIAELGVFFGLSAVRYQTGPNKFAMAFGGRKSARVTFNLMAPFVVKQVRQLATQAHKDGQYKTKSRAQTAIGNAMTIRLLRMNRENQQREQARVASGGKALVPVDAAEAAVKGAFKNLRTSKGRGISADSTARDLAQTVSLNRAIDGQSQLRIGRD